MKAVATPFLSVLAVIVTLSHPFLPLYCTARIIPCAHGFVTSSSSSSSSSSLWVRRHSTATIPPGGRTTATTRHEQQRRRRRRKRGKFENIGGVRIDEGTESSCLFLFPPTTSTTTTMTTSPIFSACSMYEYRYAFSYRQRQTQRQQQQQQVGTRGRTQTRSHLYPTRTYNYSTVWRIPTKTTETATYQRCHGRCTTTTTLATRRTLTTTITLTTKNHKQPKTKLHCQLLGMNCLAPTDFNFSFRGFAERGGNTDVHDDGWGVAFYEGRGLRCFHDPGPAWNSPVARLVANYDVKTLNMIAHIRYATEGGVCLENVHPFQREMWGIQWCFAHNGDVPLFKNKFGKNPWIGGDVPGDKIYNPVGDTDSEAVFCAILNALRARFDELPSIPVLHDTLNSLCQEIVNHDRDRTILNFLLGCGQYLQFAYSWPGSRPGSKVWNGLYYIVREPPFREAHLSDCDYSVDFARVTTDDDRVAVIATKPLTDDEDWVEIQRGELILFDAGVPHMAPADCFKVEFQGHGLDSYVIPRPASLEEDMRRFRYKQSFFAGADI